MVSFLRNYKSINEKLFTNTMDIRLQCPFTMLVVGASGSGKSVFTQTLLHNSSEIMVNSPRRIVWCYGATTEMHPGIEYFQGLPTEDLLSEGNMIMIIDDLMQQAKSSSIVSDIFTKYSRHNNITCICLLQNLFPKGSEMRNISLNSNYIVLMKNSRDRAQIQHLARQMYPGQSSCLTRAYEDATRESYGYLLLDFRNTTPEQLRIRSGMFPGDQMYAYVLPRKL